MFTVTFPVDIGTKIRTPEGQVGSIVCYQCVKDTKSNDFCVMAPGCGEYLLSELKIID